MQDEAPPPDDRLEYDVHINGLSYRIVGDKQFRRGIHGDIINFNVYTTAIKKRKRELAARGVLV